MATFIENYLTLYDMGRGQLNLTNDVIKVALFTSASNLSSTSASYTALDNEVAAGNGYASGGATATPSGTQWTASAGVATLGTLGATKWTANTASWTFRYVVYYDTTAASKTILGWYDYGSDLTLNGLNGDQFTVTPSGGTLFTIT